MSRLKSRQSLHTRDADDALLAGWMYADLFLALMVVFLATVTFIPEYLGKLDKSATNSAYNYQEIYDKPLLVVYKGFNAELIRSDVESFKKSQNLSPDSEIIYAQIVGAYNKNEESKSDAITRARIFSELLDKQTYELLKNASTTLSSTSSIPIDRVVVKFTFATNVGVKN